MTMPRAADVVIIGGGVTGASTAYHLTQRGIRDVIIADKGALASGGTGKSSRRGGVNPGPGDLT
jgi:sarcosine oxidase subunit beta